MQKNSSGESRRRILFCLVVLGLLAAVIFLPNQFVSEAGSNTDQTSADKKNSGQDEGLVKMYDIREDKDRADDLLQFRNTAGKDAADVADIRDGFVRGEEALKQQLPTAKIEYNLDIRTPEIITPDVYKDKVEFLTRPSTAKRTDILRGFISNHNELVGMTDQQIDGLKVTADYTNPDGRLSFVDFEQRVNDILVFRGEVKAGFTKDNQIIRVVNNLAPGLDYGSLSTDFHNPSDAVKAAANHIKHELTAADVSRNSTASTDLKVVFGEGDWATTAEKIYFPTEPGIAIPAWRVLIWQPIDAYYVIVDAEKGVILWHKNITDHQTQTATFNVYANSPAYINAADHAASLSPGPNNPGLGTQGVLGTRTNQTLIGNEGNSFNQLGWINDGTNITDGNNVEAGVDRNTPNGVDAPLVGNPNRVFTSNWNPPPGNPAPGDDPLTPEAQRGAVIQMFYIMNLYHDELYKRGFTEEARNFQNVNFTGMGVGNDRVSAEGQDNTVGSSCPSQPCVNNANFSTPTDGSRGRMQMYVWNGPNPDRDGTADADIIIHEVTHGTSTRLHSNSLGNQGGMMGEGWGDFYAHTMLAEPTDDINGVYGLGGYSLFQAGGSFTANHYYGIRRFPTALIASTGGPNNRPHNPLTFGHINAGCDTTLGTTTAISSAYPRNPVFGPTANCSQVHNAGEIWKSALWEVRALMITRLGFQTGTTRILDVVTNGMKMAPINPNMIQERDSIIAVAAALTDSPADVVDIREGFRRRGFGFSASVQSSTAVTEAFDSADVSTANAAAVMSGNNLLEPNECNTLNIPIVNNSGNTATNVTGVLSSTTPGITVIQPNSAYPDIEGGGGPTNNTTPYEISIDTSVACFTTANFTVTVNYSGGGGGAPLTFDFSLPIGQMGNTYIFSAATGTIPGNPGAATLVAASQQDDTLFNLTAPFAFSVYDTNVTSGQTLRGGPNGNIQLVSSGGSTAFSNTALPGTVFSSSAPTLFPYWDDLIMTTTRLSNGGVYQQVLGTAPNRQWVVEWRAQHFSNVAADGITTNFAVVFNEGSNQFAYVYALIGNGGTVANANGASATIGVQRQNAGAQFTQYSFNQPIINQGLKLNATLPPGQCSPGTGTCIATPSGNKRADFDGDGKTDISVFRPSDGNWYINRSTAGFTAATWGASTDRLVPGDYDGDGKTDTAVFRPADGAWYILKSSDGIFQAISWGASTDIVVSGDYDGDGKNDAAVFRPSNGIWYILKSGDGMFLALPFGQNGDVPVVGDYDGDGKDDTAVIRSGIWYINGSTSGFTATAFGAAGDLPVQADYDGDNKDDIAVFRPSNGTWYSVNSSNGQFVIVPFGQTGDIPVPGDYDGDGKYDQAVVRSGTWYMNQSTSGFSAAVFGFGSDKPIPKSYIP